MYDASQRYLSGVGKSKSFVFDDDSRSTLCGTSGTRLHEYREDRAASESIACIAWGALGIKPVMLKYDGNIYQ